MSLELHNIANNLQTRDTPAATEANDIYRRVIAFQELYVRRKRDHRIFHNNQ